VRYDDFVSNRIFRSSKRQTPTVSALSLAPVFSVRIFLQRLQLDGGIFMGNALRAAAGKALGKLKTEPFFIVTLLATIFISFFSNP
jgi:hypothetical protein